MFKNELLNGEIKCLENKKKTLLVELKLIENKLIEKNNNYNNNEKKKFYFEKGLCGSCYDKLSEDNIKYKTIYCEECCANDSVLEWNSNY